MAVQQEDCVSILEQFIHESANLPAEITFMLEEIQALDREQQQHVATINVKDNSLQKYIKTNGSLVAHPKEAEYQDSVSKLYDQCMSLQDKKSSHAEKALLILDRCLKKFDTKIRQLEAEGQLEHDPSLPSVWNRASSDQKSAHDAPSSRVPLESASLSALNVTAHRLNGSTTPTIRPPQPRQLAQISNGTAPVSSVPPTQRQSMASTTTTTPVPTPTRESSAQPDPKRRKLTMAATGINLPAQPSSLRQSSLGPSNLERVSTPKAGTPTGSRAGSVPRNTTIIANAAAAAIAAASTRKDRTLTNTKKAPHLQVSKLKAHSKKHARLSSASSSLQPNSSSSRQQRKGVSPSLRTGRAGTAASEDSALSSASPSDSEPASTTASASASNPASQQTKVRRNRKKSSTAAVPTSDAEADLEPDDDEEDEDNEKLYCYCKQPSHGEMVACENEDCQHEWFHIGCLGLKTLPADDKWYCPECRADLDKAGKDGVRRDEGGRRKRGGY